ncbi:hypothetical protein MD484_g233, partial [Candolleomyces efflorescens]
MVSPQSSPEISAAAGAPHQQFSYKDATEEEILEDLSSRFILNLPDEELASLERVCFQVEQAHWFYEDFIREENRNCHSLPLKKFTAMMFAACPILQHWNYEEAFEKFMQYKTLVPVCGAIMLNETWDKCVLVKGWKSSSGWGFPKGKINETEPKADCGVREVLEETGYNLAGKINPEHFIETTNNGQRITLFIVPGVPEDYPFRTKTRKEISKIEWFKLTDLPTWRRNKQVPGKFYLIAPFVGPLKGFVNSNKPRKGRKSQGSTKSSPLPPPAQANDGQSSQMTESDALQDSSSQSSSLDNGGPQTPSPQYTESTPAFVPQIAGEQTNPLLSTKALDPHFARLLSGLTLSASTPQGSEKSLKSVPEESTLPTVKESVVSVSATQTAKSVTVPSDNTRRSTPAKPDLKVSSDSIDTQNNTTTTVTVSTTSEVSSAPAVQTSFASSAQAAMPTSTSGPGVDQRTTTMQSTISPPTSPTSGAFRKSSVADISPYLARPIAAEGTSARRLQQLSLLETVANESARMTPKLANRMPYTPTGPPPPLPPLPDPRMLNSFNPNNARPMPALPPHFASTTYSQPSYDPFIRSRTSQAVHRTGFHSSPGSASMNHNQLLSLINNTRSGVGPPPPPGPAIPHAYPPAGFPSNGPYSYGPPPPAMQPIPGPHPQHASLFHPLAHVVPGPRPFSAVQPAPANQTAESLLAILNSATSSIVPSSQDSQFTRA